MAVADRPMMARVTWVQEEMEKTSEVSEDLAQDARLEMATSVDCKRALKTPKTVPMPRILQHV